MRAKRASIKEAIEWIALNDNGGEIETPEELAGYLSVALVSDLFGLPREVIAQRVHRARSQAHEPGGIFDLIG